MTHPDAVADLAPVIPIVCTRLVWAEGLWRCFLSPGYVRLYSGANRLLAHPVRNEAEGEEMAGLWLRSIRRISELADQAASTR